MTTGENTAQNGGEHGSMFNCCGEMMKMMGHCAEGTWEMKDFEQFCSKMPAKCREMMKKIWKKYEGEKSK